MIGNTIAKPNSDDLPEFNLTYYHNAILEGYKFFHYSNQGHYGIIQPVRHPVESTDGYTIHASDEEVKNMACGEDDWKIYYQKGNVL
ncbi:MAG: hypothetical protein WAU36_04160 [Cyclobacteriaceae bacterium]